MNTTGPVKAQSRVRANSLDNIRQLYQRHEALFGLDCGETTRFVLDGLAKLESKPQVLKEALVAARTHPEQVDLHYRLALLLEQHGYNEDALQTRITIARLDPSSTENKIAMGRIHERLGGHDIEKYYKHLFFSLEDRSEFLLAMARYMATSNQKRLNKTTLSGIKRRVEEALVRQPDDVTLCLARGFIGVAEEDIESAQSCFLDATLFAELAAHARNDGSLEEANKEGAFGFDLWSLQYAKAFLITPMPQELSSVVVFPQIDHYLFSIARARLALSHGLVFEALEQFWKAVAPLREGQRKYTQVIFEGFRILWHEGRFYAVPLSVRNFTIFDGVVVRIPGSIQDHKFLVGDVVTPRWRRALRPIWRFGRYRVFPALARISILRFIGRHVLKLARWTYIMLRSAPGVIVERDVVILRKRIVSTLAGASKEGAASTEAEPQKAA